MTDVRTATADDLDQVAAILADAFLDDPVMTWMYPDLASRPRLCEASYHFFAEHAYLPHGRSLIVDDAAVALWLPSGTALDDDFWDQHGAAYAEAVEWNVDRGRQLGEAMDAVHPGEPHRYLFSIGVRSTAQGRGLGGKLLATALADADTTGEPAYLEATTPRSRALYAQHGFEATDEITIGGGPTLWPMWRPAR